LKKWKGVTSLIQVMQIKMNRASMSPAYNV